MMSKRLVGWGAAGVLLVVFGLDVSLRSVGLLPLIYIIVVTVTAFASGPRASAAIAILACLLAFLAGFVNGDNLSSTYWLRVSLVCMVGIMALVFSILLARGVRRADTAAEQYRLIAENASDVVLVWGMDHRLQWVTPSVEQVLGWKPEDLLGCTISDLLDPADIERIRGIQQAVHAGGGDSARTEAPYATSSGGRRWMAITGRALMDPGGTVTGSVEALRDIQSEVEARNALVETEQHYRLIAENTSDVVIRWNNQSRVEWVSPSVKEVLGWEPHELVGKSITDLLFPDDHVRISAMKRDLLARGLIDGNVEGRYATAAGQWRWMAVHGHAIKDDTGAIVGGVEGLRDIQTEHESRELLGYMAAHDPLTRLANRGGVLHPHRHPVLTWAALGNPPRHPLHRCG